jgi:hypothetical protein
LYITETGATIPPQSYLECVKYLFKCVGVENTDGITFTVLRSSYATNKYFDYKKDVAEQRTTKSKEDFLDDLASVMNTSRNTLLKNYILVNESEGLQALLTIEASLDDADDDVDAHEQQMEE